MKKCIVSLLVLCILLSVLGCSSGQDSTSNSSLNNTSAPSTSVGPDTLFDTDKLDFTALATNIGYFEPDSELFKNARNADAAGLEQPPIYCFNNLSEIQDFFSKYLPVSTLQYPSPLEPFLQIMTEEFFEEHFLVAVYVISGNAAYCYEISEIIYSAAGQCMQMNIQNTNANGIGASVMSGWLLGACISKEYYSQQLDYRTCIQQTNTFRLSFSDDLNYIVEKPAFDKAVPGELVTVCTRILIDADLAMYINGQRHSIGRQMHSEDDFWTFSFEMPRQDVTVEFKVETI